MVMDMWAGIMRAIRPWAAMLLLALAPMAVMPLAAQDLTPPPPAAPASAASADDGVPLRFFNREVFVFRAGSLGLTPQMRQRRAAAQLRELADQPGAAWAVSLQRDEGAVALLVDGRLAFWVMPGDLDAPGDDAAHAAAVQALAELSAQRLRQALAERREAGDWRALAWSAGQVLLGLLLLWPLLWVLRRVHRGLRRRLTRSAARHASRLRVGGVTLFSGERVMGALRGLSRLVYAALSLFLAYEWLSWALQRFPYTRPLGERLQGLLLDSLALIGGGIATALPNLVVALLIFLLAHFLLSGLRPFFDRAEAGQVDLGWLNADTARPTRRLVQTAVWVFALAMAYPYLPGAQTEAFKGLTVLVGLMVSLGATSVVGQAAAGLILMYTRTLRVGEFVRVGDHEGTVVEMGAFATRIRTGLGEELTLPNALIASSVTRNYSRTVQGQGFVCDTTVTIGYDTPWRQVEALLMLAAARTPGVLSEPRPRVFQTALSDFYVAYRLVVQAHPSEPGPRAQVLNMLHGQIQDVFNEFGVQIMSPHYLGDPDQAKVVPRSRWHEAPAGAQNATAAGPTPAPPGAST